MATATATSVATALAVALLAVPAVPPADAVPMAAAASSTTTTTTATPTTPASGAPADLGTLRAAQAAVVTLDYQAPIQRAELAVADSQAAVRTGQLVLARDRSDATSAAAARAAAGERLSTDLSTLGLVTAADRAAHARLEADRARLRGIAVGLYTGAVTGPVPAVLETLPAGQQAAFETGVAEVVTETVVHDLTAAVADATGADRRVHHLVSAVASDRAALATSATAALASNGRIAPAAARLSGARAQLSADQHRLTDVRKELAGALASLAGPGSGSANGLSLIGPSALNAGQLVAWYNAQGYVDFTSIRIDQLAGWYLHAGALEGIRGDVAFAQAVLETGGFSSPDAVNLNNYAGIGHCDACSAGWKFPSPVGGVIGQLQLLRIFATAGLAPAAAPAPVLPSLTPDRQDRRGCCPTWESLTGVWATDPFYGDRVLALYDGMLLQAATAGGLSAPPATPQP